MCNCVSNKYIASLDYQLLFRESLFHSLSLSYLSVRNAEWTREKSVNRAYSILRAAVFFSQMSCGAREINLPHACRV